MWRGDFITGLLLILKCAAQFLQKILLSTNFLLLSDHFPLKHQIGSYGNAKAKNI